MDLAVERTYSYKEIEHGQFFAIAAPNAREVPQLVARGDPENPGQLHRVAGSLGEAQQNARRGEVDRRRRTALAHTRRDGLRDGRAVQGTQGNSGGFFLDRGA